MPRILTIPIGAGSEPEVIDPADAKEAVGNLDDLGDVIELCIKSPIGQCQYNDKDGWACCVHCGSESGF